MAAPDLSVVRLVLLAQVLSKRNALALPLLQVKPHVLNVT
jgi:hypothetical protein